MVLKLLIKMTLSTAIPQIPSISKIHSFLTVIQKLMERVLLSVLVCQ
jgi:hypothetical protein